MGLERSKVLVVDDEPDVVELISFNFRAAGFDVAAAQDGDEALEKTRSGHPKLIILDLMLPGLSGLEVCRILRRDPTTAGIPIIMVTAKAAEIDRVVGLELGADDYVTKPFSPRELVLRAQRLLQRSEPIDARAPVITVGELTADIGQHEVRVQGKAVDLTVTEFNLLALLMRRKGRVQSREQLLRDVWGYDAMTDTRTVDTHMRRLREKLGSAARFLDTVRGVGYRFREP